MQRIFSCPAIGTMVNFSKESLYHCCFAPYGVMPPTICKFEDGGNGVFPDEFYQKSVKQLEIANQQETGPCSGCWLLRKHKKNHISSKALRRVGLNTFSVCNADCIYCNDDRYDSFYDTHKVIKNMVERGLIDKTTEFGWGGGEPTISHELDSVFPFLADCGVPQHVYTNGIKFSPLLENSLKNNSISMLCISLDGGTPEVMAEVKRRNCFDAVWKNLRRYVQAGGSKVRAKYIFLNINSSPSEVESFILLCKQSGISQIDISVDVKEVGQGTFGEQQAAAAGMCIDMALAEGIIPNFWRDVAYTDICFVHRDVRERIMSHASCRLPVLGL